MKENKHTLVHFPTVQGGGHLRLAHARTDLGFFFTHASSLRAICSSFLMLRTQRTERTATPLPHDLEHDCHGPVYQLKGENYCIRRYLATIIRKTLI